MGDYKVNVGTLALWGGLIMAFGVGVAFAYLAYSKATVPNSLTSDLIEKVYTQSTPASKKTVILRDAQGRIEGIIEG